MLRKTFVLLCIVSLAISVPSIGFAEKAVLTIGFDAGDAESFDPLTRFPKTMDRHAVSSIYSGLVRFKPGDINPALVESDLAESWDKSADGLTWTFHLRKGVQWHRGFGEFTAEDAVWSLNMTRTKSPYKKNYEAIEEIKALDKYTIQIKLKQPVPSLLGLVTDYLGGYLVCRKAYEERGKDYPLNPIGTGPFMFEQYIPNQRTVLVANDEYFRGKPKIRKIVYRYMPDLSSREMAFRKGEVNMIEGLREQSWVKKMKEYQDTEIDIFGPGETITLHFNLNKKPFDDLRVRQAVAYALNRDSFIKFLGKDVSVPLYSPVPMDYLGGTDDVERYDYNPEKAKALLKEAGYSKLEFEDVISEMAVYRRPQEVVQDQLRKAGIKMKLQVVQHPAYHQQIRKDRNHIVNYICARFPVADSFLTLFFHSDSIIMKPTAVTNFSHYDKIDQLIEQARTETDLEKQVAVWNQAQQQILKDLAAYPLCISKLVYARKPWIKYGYELKSTMVYTPQIYHDSEVTQ